MMLSLVFCFVLTIGLSQQQSSEVAFSYGLSHDLTAATPTIVKFDTQYSNFGNGYNQATGKFVAPVAGIYVFQFHSLTQSGGSAWLELYKNGEYICSSYGHNTNDYMSAGNSVILQLAMGDEAYLMTVDQSYGDITYLYGLTDEIYTTFSGYLISATPT